MCQDDWDGALGMELGGAWGIRGIYKIGLPVQSVTVIVIIIIIIILIIFWSMLLFSILTFDFIFAFYF